MSVKFQETVQTQVTDSANDATARVADKIKDIKSDLKSEDLTHRIGEYLTGGDTGQGYLAVLFVLPVLSSKHD